MNKILPFLEKHVQWLALGLGLLYLGYMIWIYVVQMPVVVTGVAPTPLTPGEVDQYILDTAIHPLEVKMKDQKVPEMPVPNFLDRFKADMDFSDAKSWVMNLVPDSQVLPIQLVPSTYNAIPAVADITAPPKLPEAGIGTYSTGRSNVQPFVPAAGQNPAPQGNNVQAVAGNQDISWVTVSYTIPRAQLAKAFQDANIPGWSEKTSVLEVDLWREEPLPGGTWSDPKLIAPLQPPQQFPDAGDLQGQQNFLTWADAHVSDILQPAFFVVLKGDTWHAPGEIVAAAAATALPPLDPSQTYPLNVLESYPDDQRSAYFAARQKLKQSQRPTAPNQRPSGLPPGFSPSGGGPRSRNTPPAGSIGSEIFASPDVPPDAPPSAGGQAPGSLSAQFPIPAGEFDPNGLTNDITGWAHDATAEAGHTYRYMITYRIRNPIWNTNASKIPALVAQFDIRSPNGVWSNPVNVASTTNFFVYANSRQGASSARIKVYKWINGVERSHVFEVAPGDVIGGKDADVDFSTGWTVVDLRFDDPHSPDSTTVLVMSPAGVIDRRDYRTDQAKPELKALDQQVSAASAADQLAGGR
jgi:hypothetical protein